MLLWNTLFRSIALFFSLNIQWRATSAAFCSSKIFITSHSCTSIESTSGYRLVVFFFINVLLGGVFRQSITSLSNSWEDIRPSKMNDRLVDIVKGPATLPCILSWWRFIIGLLFLASSPLASILLWKRISGRSSFSALPPRTTDLDWLLSSTVRLLAARVMYDLA